MSFFRMKMPAVRKNEDKTRPDGIEKAAGFSLT